MISSPEEPSDASPTLAQPPEPRVTYYNGTVDANVFDFAQGDPAAFEFQPGNFSRMTYELTFSSPGNVQDLDALLTAPEIKCHPWAPCAMLPPFEDRTGWYLNEGGSPGSPDSPSLVEVDGATLGSKERCDGCTWTAWIRAEPTLQAQVTYSAKITILQESGSGGS